MVVKKAMNNLNADLSGPFLFASVMYSCTPTVFVYPASVQLHTGNVSV